MHGAAFLLDVVGDDLLGAGRVEIGPIVEAPSVTHFHPHVVCDEVGGGAFRFQRGEPGLCGQDAEVVWLQDAVGAVSRRP